MACLSQTAGMWLWGLGLRQPFEHKEESDIEEFLETPERGLLHLQQPSSQPWATYLHTQFLWTEVTDLSSYGRQLPIAHSSPTTCTVLMGENLHSSVPGATSPLGLDIPRWQFKAGLGPGKFLTGSQRVLAAGPGTSYEVTGA